MLHDEVAQYTKLTGEDGNHTPIMKIGAYLDGYDEGLRVLDKIRAEIERINLNEVATNYEDRFYGFQQETLAILDKYKSEQGVSNADSD